MCGIHGFVTAKKGDSHADDFISQGFVAGSLRGVDASGIATIRSSKNVNWQRLPVAGPMFLTDRYAQSLIREACNPGTISIAHTRATTTGMSSGISSAHPFYVDQGEDGLHELIGVHNGSLGSWRREEDASKFTVDSEWALNHIYKYGRKAFESFDGAFTFAWWDSFDPNSLNIALNGQRPLHIAFTDDGNMAYASEPGMLAWLMERNGIKRAGPIRALSAGRWYEFKQDDLTKFESSPLPVYRSAVTVLSTTGSRFTQSSRKTVMEAVRELFSPEKTTAIATTKGAQPSEEEVKDAKDMAILGLKGSFTPNSADFIHKTLSGEVLFEDVIMPATILDANAMRWTSKSWFNVVCVGLNKETGEDVAICTIDKSTAKLAQQAGKSATIVTPSDSHIAT